MSWRQRTSERTAGRSGCNSISRPEPPLPPHTDAGRGSRGHKLPDRSVVSPRGARRDRGGALGSAEGAPPLSRGFPTRTGGASAQRGLSPGSEAQTRRPGPQPLRRAQEAAKAARNLPLPLRARDAPASPSPAATSPAQQRQGGPTRPRARRPGAAPLSSGRTAHAGRCLGTARAAGPPGQARSHTGNRAGEGTTARQTPTPTARARPSLTCLHRVREVMGGGRGPGKFLQFPGTEVQAPGVGRFLQRALQPPVQGQVEAPAAAAASRGPAASSGSSVVVVVGMMMGVQRSHRQGRHERLGFASRRRHLLPGPPAPPRRSCGGRSHLPPPPPERETTARGRVPAALRREMPEEGRRVWQARGTGSREAEAAVAARSRRFPVPGKLRTAAAAAAAAAAAGSAHVSPPAPAPSSRLLSPPPPLALCSAFPRSRQSSPEPASAAPAAAARRRRAAPVLAWGWTRGDHGVGERLSQFCELFGFFDLESPPNPRRQCFTVGSG